MTRSRAFRPNIGGALRPQAEAPRHEFLYIHATKQEREQIRQHCLDNQLSVSQFLADLMLADASKPKSKNKVAVRAELELSPQEFEKLELLMKFHQKDTIGEFLYEVLKPSLELKRLHALVERKSLRYYLSEKELEIVSRHIEGKGLAARYYPVMLALKAIAKHREKQK